MTATPPIAAAMRHEVRARVQSARMTRKINVVGLKSRYGEWISFEPPSHGAGLVLWLLPVLLLGAALLVASSRFRKGKS
jgi:cytochrome c-type biogenesis protein CcmH